MNSLSKSINSRFRPSYVGGMPVFMCGGKMRYDLGGMMSANPMQFAQEGSQLQDYAVNALSGVMPQSQDKIGSMLQSGLQGSKYGLIGMGLGALTGLNKHNQDKTNQEQSIMNSQLQNLLSNLPEQQQYTMASGGFIDRPEQRSTQGNEKWSDDGIKMLMRDYRKSPEWWAKSSGRAEITDSPIDWVIGGAPMMDMSKGLWHLGDLAAKKIVDDAGGIMSNIALKTAAVGIPAFTLANFLNNNKIKANGGYLPSYATGGMLQGSTSIKTGGTHESSSLGGVPIGNQGKVEEGEYIWNSPNGKYVFSSRF